MIVSDWKYSKNNGIGNIIEINRLLLVAVAKADRVLVQYVGVVKAISAIYCS